MRPELQFYSYGVCYICVSWTYGISYMRKDGVGGVYRLDIGEKLFCSISHQGKFLLKYKQAKIRKADKITICACVCVCM